MATKLQNDSNNNNSNNTNNNTNNSNNNSNNSNNNSNNTNNSNDSNNNYDEKVAKFKKASNEYLEEINRLLIMTEVCKLLPSCVSKFGPQIRDYVLNNKLEVLKHSFEKYDDIVYFSLEEFTSDKTDDNMTMTNCKTFGAQFDINMKGMNISDILESIQHKSKFLDKEQYLKINTIINKMKTCLKDLKKLL